MHHATDDAMMVAVRIFETYPPSTALLVVAVVVVWLIAGLPLVAPVLVGAVLMDLGHRLDIYGVRREP